MTGLRLVLVAFAAAGLIAAGCGGDDNDDGSGEDTATVAVPGADQAAALQEEIADLSDEEQITRVGEAWAEPFAAGDERMCGYLHSDLGAAASCSIFADGALTGGGELQASFSGATVKRVDVQGDTAFAEFSTGNRVKFQQEPDGAWKVVETPRVAFSGSEKVRQPE
jgi:hypothetical protein